MSHTENWSTTKVGFMKQLRMIMLIVIWLASQQVVAAMPAFSSQQGPVSPEHIQSMQPNCHDSDEIQLMQSLSGHQAGTADKPSHIDSSCCKSVCQCATSCSHALPASLPSMAFSGRSPNQDLALSDSFPHPPEHTLFRPPITA